MNEIDWMSRMNDFFSKEQVSEGNRSFMNSRRFSVFTCLRWLRNELTHPADCVTPLFSFLLTPFLFLLLSSYKASIFYIYTNFSFIYSCGMLRKSDVNHFAKWPCSSVTMMYFICNFTNCKHDSFYILSTFEGCIQFMVWNICQSRTKIFYWLGKYGHMILDSIFINYYYVIFWKIILIDLNSLITGLFITWMFVLWSHRHISSFYTSVLNSFYTIYKKIKSLRL